MNRILSGVILLFLFLSQTQIGVLYAAESEKLSQAKETGQATLDAVGAVIDRAVIKIDNKISHEETSEKLQDKSEEIDLYLEEVAQEISQENSSSNIEEKVEEATKVVILKVVSGVTPLEDTTENISDEVASTQQEKQEAAEVLQESFETESGDYKLIVQTKYSQAKTRSTFHNFDTNTKVEFLYEVGGQNYFELTIQEDSLFRQEMMEDIESGILPKSFGAISIVLPEVFSISSGDLGGEDLSKTWGITQYASYNYTEDFSENSQNISVGVVDTGIDYTHPDLSGVVNVHLGKDFVNADDDAWDDQGHGTHVAGTIAASINGGGIIGVNPYVDLVPLKICSETGFCPSYAVIEALDYASRQDIDILNMSLGGRGDPNSHAICDAISSYTSNGGIVVAAAGNSNIDTSSFVPGGCEDAITVAAVDRNMNRAAFSNYGSKVDVSAPGVDIYSTYPTNKGPYRELSGTSMAAPHVAGLVSIIQSYDDNVSGEDIKNIFQESAISLSPDKAIGPAVDVIKMMNILAGEDPIEEELAQEEELPEENTGEEKDEENTQEEGEEEYGDISEYIPDYEHEQYDEIPDPEFILLDDLTLLDIQSDSDTSDPVFVEERIFDLSPQVDLSTGIEINSVDEEKYHNENTQNFSIAPDEEDDLQEEGEVFERVLLPEVIGNGPNYNVQDIELENPFFQESDGLEINNVSQEVIIHKEVTEGDQTTVQEIIVPTDDGDKPVEVDSPEPINVEELLLKPIFFEDGEGTSEEEIYIQNHAYFNVTSDEKDTLKESVPLVLEEVENGEIVEVLDEEIDISDTLSNSESLLIDELPEQSESIGIQNIQSCEFEILKQRCKFSLVDTNKYQIHDSNPGIVNYSYDGGNIYFFGGKTGTTTYTLLKNDIIIHTFHITAIDAASGHEYLTTQEGDRVYITAYYASRYIFTPSRGVYTDISGNSLEITGMKAGNHNVSVRDRYTGEFLKTFYYEVQPLPPTVHEMELYVGDYVNALYHKSYFKNYNFSTSDSEIASSNRRYKWLYVKASKAGYTEIYAKDGEILRNVIKVTVKDIPVPIDLECTVVSGDTCSLELPEYSEYSSSQLHRTITRGINFSDNTINIQTVSSQYYTNASLQVRGGDRGFLIANIKLNLQPDIPNHECHMVKGGKCELSLEYAYSYEGITDTPEVFGYSTYKNTIYINGKDIGEGVIEFRNSSYKYAARVHVYVYDPALVSLQETSCEIWEIDKTCEIDFLSSHVFQYTTSTPGIVEVRTQGDKISIVSKKLGETNIYVKFGDITVGVIHVKVGTKAESFKCELNIEKECDIYLGKYASSMKFESSEPGFIQTYRGGYRSRDLYIKALQKGNVILYVWDGKYKRYKAQVHITITEPTESSCTILEGDSCEILGLPWDYNYEILRDGTQLVGSRRYGRTSDSDYLKVGGNTQGLRSGKLDLNIYKRGLSHEYHLHDIYIEVIEAAYDETSECEIRVNGSCGIVLRNVGTNKYTHYVTNPGILYIEEKTNELYLKGIREGETEILIYNNETGVMSHRAKITIAGEYKVLAPRIKTTLSDTGLDLKVGESKIVEITQGNKIRNYTVIKSSPNIDVSYAGTNGLRVTAVDDTQRYAKVDLIDKDKEYSNAAINVNIVIENTGGGNSDNGENSNEQDSEESDGEGEEQSYDEFENILEEIFSAIGVGDITINSTEIPKLKDSSKKKIDGIIQRIITNEGEQYTLNLQSSIPSLKEIYTSVQQHVILDYVSVSIDKYLGIKIIEYDYTSKVEDGYVGGIYFKVNNPDLVQEAGIEYYYGSTTPVGGIPWSKEILNVTENDIGVFLVPKTNNMLVRGYVKDYNDNIEYTQEEGDLITSDIAVHEYYQWQEILETNSVDNKEDGVEVNAIPIAAYYGVLALVNAGFKLYDWYTVAQDCHNDGYLSINCAVNLGLSIIPVGGTGQAKNVLEFAGSSKKYSSSMKSSTVGSASTSGWKSIDEVTWVQHYPKHTIAKKTATIGDLHEISKNKGPAQYLPSLSRKEIELKAWKDGIKVTNGKTWKVYKSDSLIGSSDGKVSYWMRIEESSGFIHGHPITKESYDKLLK